MSQFGFTTNQAKVYLSIIQAGSIPVGKISKVTMLHRQDIYKILPKLEKKGLITKTISKPFKIQAVPLETALHQLVSSEKEKSNKKIASLETNLKNLVESLKDQPKNEDEPCFTLLTTDDSIRCRANLLIKTLKKEVKVVTSAELLLSFLDNMHELIGKTPEKQTKLSLLVTPFEGQEAITKAIEKLRPNQNQIVTKVISNAVFKHYLIVDRKEVWIATEQKTESGLPCMLWTNDKNIVHVYDEYFDRGWNHSNAVKLHPRIVEKRSKGSIILV